MTAIKLVQEALAEDARERSHFDATGFHQFFPEENEDTVRQAWLIYDQIVNGSVDQIVNGRRPIRRSTLLLPTSIEPGAIDHD
jgi:hypothetical protein